MEDYQKELTLIKSILKTHPKGMTVTDIAREIKINRNSVAKYLDILLISGHVEMITFGPAKVFFPSRRIPLHIVLNFVSDCILVIDANLKITLVNDMLLKLLQRQRDDVLGQSITHIDAHLLRATGIIENIQNTLDGKEYTEEICYQIDDEEYYFCIRLLPTTFEDGGQGVALILTNITDKKRIENALKGKKTDTIRRITINKENPNRLPETNSGGREPSTQ